MEAFKCGENKTIVMTSESVIIGTRNLQMGTNSYTITVPVEVVKILRWKVKEPLQITLEPDDSIKIATPREQ
mgnify:CR=1 FL=1